MESSARWDTETITFETSDGVTITGDVAAPAGDPADRAADGAIVCHPHPQYGGDRHNPVVVACWQALADRGVPALRFGFRSEFGGGIAERLDASAALDALGERVDGSRFVAVGYSFGAMVTLGCADPRIRAMSLIAPPLTAMQVDVVPSVPTLVLTPAHDQFTPPDTASPIVDGWRADNPDVTFETLPMVDHFLAGHVSAVAERTVDWLTALTDL